MRRPLPEQPLINPQGVPFPRGSSKARALSRYTQRCPACGVRPKISEKAILKALAKGMESQGFELVQRGDRKIPGTPVGMINQLIAELRARGIQVV